MSWHFYRKLSVPCMRCARACNTQCHLCLVLRGTVNELPELLQKRGVNGINVAVPQPLEPMQVTV